ncbi:glycosyltransferase [Methanosphaera sp. ISO3-F5]|uniref:glycosyltransferase n=1 Tax=Methanosphaera sp. ISO3-F5 TaxID=1452353 RepID=UPI002B25701B|nr:glycosyltransferase [Methanosphaera sp. ISO3-F5]WQH63498.1 glycosyltransferase [Methanosphaera sp. ISO3-F5]
MAYGIKSMSANAIKTKIIRNKLFDEEYYLSFIKEENIDDALEHYLNIGYKMGLNPSPFFDTKYYLEHNPDVKNTNMNPLAHYAIYELGSDKKIKFDLSLSEYKKFIELVYAEKLFDEEYYRKQCKDEKITDLMDHYIYIGSKNGLNPSILFDTNNYLKNNHDVSEKKINPLIHYVLYALNSERKVKHDLSIQEWKNFRKKVYREYLFNDSYYLSNLKETQVTDPLDHYLSIGYHNGLNPSEYFETTTYLENNPDVKKLDINPLIHYVLYSFNSNRKVKINLSLSNYKKFKETAYKEKLFIDEYYLNQFSEKINNPFDHYLTIGWKENKNPSYRFNTQYYLQKNRDVKESGINPLFHLINYSLESNRKFNFDISYPEFKKFEKEVIEEGFFEEEYYTSQLNEYTQDPLGHYLEIGWKENKNPSYIFDTNEFLKYNSDSIKGNNNPLIYFMLNDRDKNHKINYGFSYKEFCGFEKKVKQLGLFDEEYYRVTNPDVHAHNLLSHYLTIGFKEGRNPSGLFDTNCYLKNSRDIVKLGLNPLIHYANHAYNGNRKIKCDLSLSKFNEFKDFIINEGFYDEEYYLEQCNTTIIDPLDHYLTVGWKKNKNPSPLFNTKEYLRFNEDIRESGMNPLLHYVKYGMNQSRIFNFGLTYEEFKNFQKVIMEEELFDEEYYLNQLKNQEIKYPLYHYLTEGYKLGLDPSVNFSTSGYLSQYTDIANDGRNPLVHFCQYGMDEDRIAKYNITLPELKEFRKKVVEEELFDEEYYLSQCNEKNIRNPLDHYVEIGSKKGLNPSILFNTNNYIKNNPNVKYLNKNPLVHYTMYAYDSNRKVNHDLSLKQYKKFRNFVIKEKYFDEKYYLSNLQDTREVNDALEHYLNIGYEEGYDPSEKFNTSEYLEEYPGIGDKNPLIHYIMNLLNAYDTLSDSELFDEEFYLTHLDDYLITEEDEKLMRNESDEFEKKSKYDPEEIDDPVMHYLTIGVKDGLNPNPYFSSLKYLEWNQDVKDAGLDPLYHYIIHGKRQTRDSYMVLSNHLKKFDKRYKIHSTSNMLKALKNKVSIIIPIYNAYEETKECITSVLRNTHINYELILINDCSTDKRIDELLDSLRYVPQIRIIRNKENQGFIRNVNMGMNSTKNDVVLLNSDTIVTPHWLSHLVYCAYSSNEIGTVTPFSNASDISIQEFDNKNFDEINKNAYRLDKLSYNLNIEAPTGNGFCMFIKRACIEEVGLFDETFGKGYGEETDFTYRALNNGWLNIRNDSVFIYHRRHASFKKENTNNLKARNKKILEKRYPSLYDDWNEFVQSKSLQDSLERIRLHHDDIKNPERILYVTGIEKNTPILDEDYHKIADYYDTYILTLHSKQIKLGVIREGRFVLYEKWDITSKWDQNTYVSLYTNILLNLKIDLVYVKYLYSYYNPNNQDLSLFIRLLSRFEIQALYEATCNKENIHETIHNLLNPHESLKELINKKTHEIDFNNSKLVVYTALTGNYDELVTPLVINPKFDYICFTDNPNLKSDFWTIKYMEEEHIDKIRKARKYKILPHKYLKEYDYSLWIDANFDIIGDIEEYIHKYSSNNKLLVIKHDIRDDIYDEAEECIRLEKDTPELIHKQIARYAEDNYPRHNGLIASGIIFRNHNNQEVKALMNEWYREVQDYSRRDQLSFNYVCWKNNFEYDESPIFYFKNQYFQRLLHVGDNNINLKYDEESINRILESFNQKTSIIIPIYNAYEETKACIESVLKYTTTPYELLLINDCSTDKRIEELLSKYQDYLNITVINNEQNQGFVRNINLGFEKTSDDVIILNSDTEVTPKWLQKLKIAAYSKENIATVTPLSNNAGAFSVPIVDEDNELQPELGVTGTSNLIEKISKNIKLYVPTGNGFCMYIKREAIYSVGFFDQIFGKGYCEENDFCMRLLEKGWLNVIEPSTYIYHKHNVSFASLKDELYLKNRQLLEEKYPDYSLKLLDMLRSYNLRDIRKRIAVMLESENNYKFNVQRILYLIHEGTGGTLHTSIELMGNLPDNIESYILTAGKEEIKLYKYTKSVNDSQSSEEDDDEFLQHLTLLSTWTIKNEYSIKDVFNNEFRRIYFNILCSLKIDLVHIRHLIRHSFDMPYIAKQIGIPVILSFHDFYYVCPSHNLIDDTEKYCGGHCSPIKNNQGQCDITGGLNAPLLKTYITQWRKEVSQMLDNCDAFVTTSQSAYDIYTEFYPKLSEKTFMIIEHGRDISTPDKINQKLPTFKDQPIRILFPGHINVNKGGWLIKAIKEYDTENRLEFHYMGNIHSKFHLEDIGIHHGYYKRSEFCKEVEKIKPHFIGLFSIWPETYCHTLTESWGCGIPVITLDMGALGERVKRHGGGYFIENNPKKAYDKIIEISENDSQYDEIINQITKINFKSTKQMADEYMELYKNFLDFN